MLESTNRLFVLARSGKRLTPAWLSPILAIVFMLLGSIPALIYVVLRASMVAQPGQAPSFDEVAALMFGSPLDMAVYLIAQFVPVTFLLWLWVRFFEGRNLPSLGLERRNVVVKAIAGGAFGTGAFALVAGLLLLTGNAQFSGGSALAAPFQALLGVLVVLIGFCIQGPTEELVFRGFLLPTFGARTKPVWGVAISSILFGLMHSLNNAFSPIALLNIVLVGVFLALYALVEGGLWGVCAWHATWNWAQGIIFGFPVSGSPFSGALLQVQTSGVELFDGGEFGPEGGLITTLVLVLCISGLLIFTKRDTPAQQPA